MPRTTINIDQVVKGLNKDKEQSKKALKRTISDMRSRGPGWVSKAVREEYNIKAGDVKAAMHTEKAGSISFGGVVVDNVALVYRGRHLTHTHFNMRYNKSSQPYPISAEVKKGNRRQLHGKSRNVGKPFLIHSGGANTKKIPFQRVKESRIPLEAIKTISIPQMVQDGNGNLKPGVEKAVNENLEKRFKHHIDQEMGK